MSKFQLRTDIMSANLLLGSLCAYCCALSFGIAIGYSSQAIPSLIKAKQLTEENAGQFGSILTIGAIFGGPIAGWFVQRSGRRLSILYTNIPFLIGWFVLSCAKSTATLYTGRFITGVASGMAVVAAPLYIAETCPKDSRGFLGSGVQLSITIGIFMSYLFGMWYEYDTLAEIAMVPALLGIFLVFRVYDTPRFYLLQNSKLKSQEALRWLRGPSQDVDEELRDIEESIDNDSITLKDFGEPQLLNPLKVSLGLMICQQLTGINVVMFYTTSIFTKAGLSGPIHTVTLGLVQVIFTFVACLLMDRAGRRFLLLAPGVVMAITMFVFGFYFKEANKDPLVPPSTSAMPVICLAIYIVGFSLGWGPVPMLVMAEVFPAKARGVAGGMASFASWSSAFLITYGFSYMQSMLGPHGAFWLFAALCLVGVIFVWIKVPETKGKSLEDIELYFMGRTPMHGV